MQRPQLEILICTVEPRLSGAEQVLLPPMDGVAYLVSCQYATAAPPVPQALQRPDVRVTFLQGRGLSRNRNHALLQSAGEFLLLCDDDEQLVPESLASLVALSRERRWQMVQLQADGLNKQYPADYVSSVELLLSREVGQRIRFDERFGLGSDCLASGEEEVFVSDAQKAGYKLEQHPLVVCRIDGPTTGDRFLTSERVQRSKGAVFCRTRGVGYAYYKCVREALGWWWRSGRNPLPLLRNMLWGIRYVSA